VTQVHNKDGITIHNGNCLEVLATMPAESIDSIVTDPPYGLSFMGKKWDYDVPDEAVWRECLRVLKPGGHLLAFAGTRTQHRMAVRIEDAGFEIRDMIAWVYGSGFPKSLDVSKAIDKGEGENKARQLRFTEWMRGTGITSQQIAEATRTSMASHYLTAGSQPAIATADLFDKMRPYLPEVPEEIERLVAERTGIEWTAYKNRAVIGEGKSGATAIWNEAGMMGEFNITAPATEAAKQWQGWGTALKPALEPITVARKPLVGTVAANVLEYGTGGINVDACRVGTEAWSRKATGNSTPYGSETTWNTSATPDIDSSKGRWPANLIHDGSNEVVGLFPEEEEQSASRFFYCAKAGPDERRDSKHPTVKPVALMRYLVRLVTPIGATVLDPFCGSGTTLEAAMLESCKAIGIEMNPEYCGDAVERLRQGVLF
jgi:site-specific DNA-methyltransferase (adenine-specific)